MKAHEYIPSILMVLTGLFCLAKWAGVIPFDWVWAFVLIWGPIVLFLGTCSVVAALVMVWSVLSRIVAIITGAEDKW